MSRGSRSYDRSFLEDRGYFDRCESNSVRLDGDVVEFDVDPDAHLAYLDGVDPDRQPAVVRRLRIAGPAVDYCWFWNGPVNRVAVYRPYGECEWFVHDGSRDPVAKERTLGRVGEGLDRLFDVGDAVNRFYRAVGDLRSSLAESLDPPGDAEVGDEGRLLAAQRIVDRLVFAYVLVEKRVVHAVDETGERFELEPEDLRVLVEEGRFEAFLDGVSFEYLAEPGWSEHRLSEGIRIAIPYLHDGLFRNRSIPTVDGDRIQEREFDVSGFDWAGLLDELGRYDWLTGERAPWAADGPVPAYGSAKLEPGVLGHVFERFAAVRTDGAGSDERPAGRRTVGAYYTPRYVAVENARETLWNRVRHRLAGETSHAYDGIPNAEGYFHATVAGGEADVPGIEALRGVLRDFTVVDPSVGGGAFLLVAGKLLADWRSRCEPDRPRSEIRREIVSEALYGVDLLDGAVEVCRLRLWLWIACAIDVDLTDPEIAPLPDVDRTIRQGNALVGFGDPDGALAGREVDREDGETHREAINEYRRAVERDREIEDAPGSSRHERLGSALDRAFARESSARIEEEVGSFAAYREILAGSEGRIKLSLDFDSAMTDAERRRVAAAGFREQRNWETTAYRSDARTVDDEDVRDVFALMDGRGTVTVERPVRADDVADLDPFHWPIEFPTAYARAEGWQFDVVLGNPPHGSTLCSVAESIVQDAYGLVEGACEVAKLFTERGWELAGGELSFVVPKSSTYNTNWNDFRTFSRGKLHRGVDLGKAFRGVDHEQVTLHLSRHARGDSYECGSLPAGAYRIAKTATVDRAFAAEVGTLPVSLAEADRRVATWLTNAGLPSVGERDVEIGRGASRRHASDETDLPVSYNGKQVQRYFTRVPVDRIDPSAITDATRDRVERPKVVAQNIIAHVTRPYDHLKIAAAYDPVGVYDFETVTNVVVEETPPSPPSLAVLLNSPFVNWFVYTLVFNRAVRDMHLDAPFLRRVPLPARLSETEDEVLSSLYGLLSATAVATEYELAAEAPRHYSTLQSVAGAASYELYFRSAPADPMEPIDTGLLDALDGVLGGYEVSYEGWLADHLRCTSEAEVREAFASARPLLETAGAVAADLSNDVADELAAVATHPGVRRIERDRHFPKGADPDAIDAPNDVGGALRFGPTITHRSPGGIDRPRRGRYEADRR